MLALATALALLAAGCGRIAKPLGWAAPVAEGDQLFVSLDHGAITAVSAADPPQPLWHFPQKDTRVSLTVKDGDNQSNPKAEKLKLEGIYGDPAATAGMVYITAYSGHVVAINRADGTGKWAAQLPGRIIGGALAEGGRVYAATNRGELFSLAADSGFVQWRRRIADEVWSTPLLVEGLVVIAGMDGSVSAYDADGNRRWRERPAGRGIAAALTLADGRLYAASFDQRVYALDPATGKTVWRSATADNWLWTPPVVSGGLVYAGSLDGTLYAFDAAADNSVRWQHDLGDMLRSRPVVVNGTVIAGATDGRLLGFQAADGTPLWEQAASGLPSEPNAPRGDLYAALLARQNAVYFITERSRGNDSLYVFDVSARTVREVKLQ